jgi:hypothetical protein
MVAHLADNWAAQSADGKVAVTAGRKAASLEWPLVAEMADRLAVMWAEQSVANLVGH